MQRVLLCEHTDRQTDKQTNRIAVLIYKIQYIYSG